MVKKPKYGKYVKLVGKSSSSKLIQPKAKSIKKNCVLPGTFHINISDSLDKTYNIDMEITAGELYCIFTKLTVRNNVSVIFTKWFSVMVKIVLTGII